ncbi:DUF3253 domain-containing protein [Algoriphagus winogradskyi]|jgi:exopolysaccharide biosynthesis protein|uniref:DUF3253 domain-containing protein n=1 Tax=Algoriphagus winogradskyi TaxID=237017 RepID=A0ABY1P6Y9_9BACT|nr:DUF3253 domain-containing protein [Algoriphagus winogradskyi]SMP25559.1 Protein of unknown function [Algoriphagus winogradskyi]
MEVLRTAILDMLRRKKDDIFSSSEVVKQMYPEDWDQFLPEINKEAMALHREGLLNVCDAEKYSEADLITEAELKISRIK